MFTGIVENTATVVWRREEGTNVRFCLISELTGYLHVDQSVSHNGVCLTVERIDGDEYEVVAVNETLRRSNMGSLKVLSIVNLERSMELNSRLDGHIVQGHVDTTARCDGYHDENGSRLFRFYYSVPPEKAQMGYLTVEKGSVCVNGVSLTVVDSRPGFFTVAIIPYTLQHTNFGKMEAGAVVNIEFDIIGKYVAALAAARSADK